MNKTKNHTSKTDNSQAKLTELQRIHEQTKSKQKAEVQKWESKHHTLLTEKRQLEAAWARTKALLITSEKEMGLLRKKDADLHRQTINAKENRQSLEESNARIDVKLKNQAVIISQMQGERDDLIETTKILQSLVEEGEDALLEQISQRRALERIAKESTLEVKRLQGQLQASTLKRSISKVENRRLRARLDFSEMENGQHQKMIEALKDELRVEKILSQEEKLQLDQGMTRENVEAETVETNILSPFDEVKDAYAEATESLWMASEAALQDELERGDDVYREVEELNVKYLQVLQGNSALREKEHSFEKLQQELESVEEAYEKGLLEVMRAHKGEEEVKRQLSQVKAENQGLTNKLRLLEKIGKRVFHAKMKEEAWLIEREELLLELESASQIQAKYDSLRSEAQVLLSRSNLYETQRDELSNLNNMLASHTNPSQKIYYLDRIRRELDDKRMQCQVLVAERDELQIKVNDLTAKLDLFVKVGSKLEDRPKTQLKRVARQSGGHSQRIMDPHSSSYTGILIERSPNKGRISSSSLSPRKSPNKKMSSSPVKGFAAGRKHQVKGKSLLTWSDEENRQRDDQGQMTLHELMMGV